MPPKYSRVALLNTHEYKKLLIFATLYIGNPRMIHDYPVIQPADSCIRDFLYWQPADDSQLSNCATREYLLKMSKTSHLNFG